VTNHLDSLTDDMADVVKRAPRDMVKVVREGIRVGNQVAKDYAKQSAGAHGKHYHRAFSSEMHGVVGFGGVFGYSGEYGPDIAKPQGGMSFERGSRNQPPHNDLAKSADLIGPSFAQEVRDLPDDWFWS
jgi:hypothetical protein